MGGDISMCFEIILSVLMKILVQNLNNRQWRLIIFTKGNVMTDSITIIFKDAIKMNQAIEKQIWIASDIRYDIEHTEEYILRNFFFLKKLKILDENMTNNS